MKTKRADIRKVHGTVAEVTCECGHVHPHVCLAQHATAIACFGCEAALPLPDWSEWRESENSACT